MKKTIQLLLWRCICAFLFISCVNNKMEDVVFEKDKQINYEEIISKLGFDENSVMDMGDYFLIEGDIMLEKEELQNLELMVGTRQARTPLIMNDYNRVRVRICLDQKLQFPTSTKWIEKIGNAAGYWNNAGRGYFNINWVRYDVLGCGEHSVYIRFAIPSDKLPDNTFGAAEFPLSNGGPGRTIIINQAFITKYKLNDSQIMHNLVHEIGHVLGFRHTNWQGLGEGNAIGIPGTPNSGNNPDPNSVMNGGTALNSWNGFSSYDYVAMRNLYPVPYVNPYTLDDIEITSYQSGKTSYMLELKNTPDDITTSWRITWGNCVVLNETDYFIELGQVDIVKRVGVVATVTVNGVSREISHLLLPPFEGFPEPGEPGGSGIIPRL